MAVITAVRSTVEEPWASLELAGVATRLRRSVTDSDGTAMADNAIHRRVQQRIGRSVRRSGRRVTGRRRRRRRRRRCRRRHLFRRFRRRENGSDLQRMSQLQRSTIVFFDYVRQIFVAGDGDQGLQVSVRQLTPQGHRRTAQLSKLHHQLCTTRNRNG